MMFVGLWEEKSCGAKKPQKPFLWLKQKRGQKFILWLFRQFMTSSVWSFSIGRKTVINRCIFHIYNVSSKYCLVLLLAESYMLHEDCYQKVL